MCMARLTCLLGNVTLQVGGGVGVLGVENRVVNKMLRKFPQYLEEALTLAF